ncbi:hypothetical protein [Streptomyces sp. H34-S4]|uniref:hypothetical protein n=1 Tax=Streptomyces sp. H34-S4 TaxID=2996463 RepID=UPI00226ED70E|nr:hypothetical protein [Streptomyces sp. H34-S4]MCY0935361.1 hypothetical protein [Streptomyces sp. H34-S4]
MSISVPGVLLRNVLALAAEYAALLLLRGAEPPWIPVLLALFAFASGLPNGTDTELVPRLLLAGNALLIAVAGRHLWPAPSRPDFSLSPPPWEPDPALWKVAVITLVLIQTLALIRLSRHRSAR